MNKEKIAILVDSGSDVPQNLVEKYNMYVARLKILYKDGEYRDGTEISAEEVYSRLKEEIPKAKTMIFEFVAVLAAHIGLGGVASACITDQPEHYILPKF